MVLSNYNLKWHDEFARYPGIKLEYVPLDLMWKAANYSGMSEHYPHFFAKSAYFSFFLYDPDKFWVYDIFRVPLVQNALNACNIRRSSIEPETFEQAVSFIYQMINSGNLVWITYIEPILIYGFEGIPNKERIHWYNPNIAPDGATWGRDELEMWWMSQKSIGQHTLIAPLGVVPGINPEEEITAELAKLVIKNWQSGEIIIDKDSIAAGISAYEKFISDLRNDDFDFLKPFGNEKTLLRTAWFTFAAYSQWTQYYAAHAFFTHIADSYSETQKKTLRSAADHYANAYGHWINWEKVIGRHPNEEEFFKRIGIMENRLKAADYVDMAKLEVGKAIESLGEFLESQGISPDDKEEDETENETED